MRNLYVLVLSLCILFSSAASAKDVWQNLPQMKRPRSEASAVLYQNEIYVFNGFAPLIDIENTVEKYNPKTSQWTLLGTTSTNLGNAVTHNGIVLHGQDVWLIGGRIGDNPGAVSNKVWIYNIGSGNWRKGPNLPKPMAGGGAAIVNNKIHWFGGLDPHARCDISDHYVLDLAKQSSGWKNISHIAPMPAPRNHFATVALNGKIYAIGGQFGHDGCPGKPAPDTSLVHMFNVQTNKWTRLSNLPSIQSHTEPSTFAHNGLIYMVGGQSNGNKVLRYDPKSDKWTHLYTLPQALLAPVANIINGKLIVGGGGAPTTQVPTKKVIAIQIEQSNISPTEPTTVTSDTTTDPVVTAEAENYDYNSATTTHKWIPSNLAGASGSGAMVTTPNSGALHRTASKSPYMSYKLNFPTAGKYYLWIRAWGDENSAGEGKSDSLHAGLNNQLSNTADKIDGFPPGWHWSRSTRDGMPAYLNVPSSGLHTVNLWMREDGLAVDKFLLTPDASFAPNGVGPTASSPSTPLNRAPKVDVGANISVDFGDQPLLNGQVQDDGLPTSDVDLKWSQVSGPSSVVFATPLDKTTKVSFSAPGIYTLKLTANDGSLTSSDSIIVTVVASNQPTPSNGVQLTLMREAEDYDVISQSSSHQWIQSTLPNASALVTSPNNGALQATSANSPMLGYLINFAESGKYYLWVRGWGDEDKTGEGKDDSVHAGLNGKLAASGDKIDGFPPGWNWSRSTRDGAVATLSIPSSGLHTVNFWMREDGLAFDKFLLSKDPNFVPAQSDFSETDSQSDSTANGTNTNSAPIANAGPDQQITFNTVAKLNATAKDDGYPDAQLHYKWQKKSGPGTVTFTSTSLASTSATFSAAGQYVLILTVSDGQLSDTDLIGIRVNEPSSSTDSIDAFTAWNIHQSANGSSVVARHEAGAVAVNGKIIVLGGRGNKPVQSWNPSTNTWISHGKAPVDMHHFQPVAIGNEIFVIGAQRDGGYPLEKSLEHIYILNVSTNSWRKGPSIPSHRRRGSTGAAVYNGKIYLVGGNTLGHSGPSVNWFDEFDPKTGAWRVLPNAPHARDHATIAVVNNKLVVAGGRRSSQPNVFANTEAATDVYNFSLGKWESANNIPTHRAGTMTIGVNSEVVVIGGESATNAWAHDTVEALNVQTGKWRKLQPLSQGRHSGGATVLGNKIHVISGNKTRGGGAESTLHETLSLP